MKTRQKGFPMPVHRGASIKFDSDDCFAPLIEAAPDRPFVIAQLGQSLDGRIATLTGASRWINRGAALDHLHHLRARVDAVIIGAGTAVADDPLLTVRRVKGPNPARVVIDPDGQLRPGARCLTRDGTRAFVIHTTKRDAPIGAEAIVLPASGPLIDPHQIVEALFQRGYKRILVEGGAATVSAFIDAGAVNRLHVLVAPVILGSGIQGLNLAPIAGLHEAHRPLSRVYVLDDGDVLFDCDLKSTG